jgi:HSP20 family protein
MADITVRKESNPQAAQLTTREPFRAMRDALRLDPFREMPSLLRGWDLFNEMAPLLTAAPMVFTPAFEVKETADAYLFKADVPGVKENDIDVTLTGNRLSVSGARHEEKEEKSDTYYSCERQYGSFSRSYTLPEGADSEHIHASLQAGVLTVAVPKKPGVLPKKIQVKAIGVKA